ncbi:hypothetical protein ACFYOG_32640 [Streptomyces sp. NPDC007818]|uniref:hypothetical protein n=1 Tax=Streptomyces sp. NPDC007818 TaxID=3364780 RepID=UPI0036C9AAAF
MRQSSRLAGSVLLAGFILAFALVYSTSLPAGLAPDAAGGQGGSRALWLLVGVVAVFVPAQAALDLRVRRVDRRAGAELRRRVAQVARPSWRAVVGGPRAALAAGTYAGALALTAGAMASTAPGVRYAATVLLIGVCAAATVTLVQLRHVLTHPAVADDEAALRADDVLRAEDAREAATPTMVWCLPWYIPATVLTGDALLRWNIAWIALIVLGAVALAVITLRSARAAVAASRRTAVGG